MSERPVLQRARIGRITVAGGLIVGISLFATTPVLRGSAAFASQDRLISGQAREVFLEPNKMPSFPGAARCNKSLHSTNLSKADPPPPPDYGTMGMGFNCTGAPRSQCPGAV
jgi:hypothetical protein